LEGDAQREALFLKGLPLHLPFHKKEAEPLAQQEFKYRRADFSPLPVKLDHLTIHLNLSDESVEAVNLLHMTALKTLDRIELDAKDLEILHVEWLTESDDPEQPGLPLDYCYLRSQNKLIVALPGRVKNGQPFRVRTTTRCIPSDRVLEGIYRDSTPPGAPQQYMSQCQQWGFQRIMPIFDDCRAKCTMTTTIEADKNYTHLISNGNISKDLNPDGKPVPKPGDPSRQIIRYENSIPMAPYLFLAVAGTWAILADQVTYPSGRVVRLEYLVPPGRTDHARIPMEILKRSVLWIAQTQDYEYAADTYRTICMNKSNFGGMENVGNTTIVTDAALIDEHTLDQSLLYAHAVVVHEFEHNQCGSETTMDTPFDVWLNEAYTVDVERQFVADMFNPAFIRLNQVDSIRNPLLGPLAIEDAGLVGRIVREGFNEPDELIDGVTYVKAAEVIRMLRAILGAERFRAGKALYFSQYKDSNADTDQFFDCFEEVSGRSLAQFKDSWLYTLGYPKVTARTEYSPESRTYTIHFRQESSGTPALFHVPVELALVDEQGSDIPGTARIFELDRQSAELRIEHVSEPPAFPSINRGYSFYGTFELLDATPETLARQARFDPDPTNRVEAMRKLTDRQRVRLLLDPESHIDSDWLEVYAAIMARDDLPAGLKAYSLRIDEQPLDREYATWFPELVIAREKLMAAVNIAFRKELVDMFQRLDTYAARQSPRDGIEERVLKNLLLDLIVVDDSPDSHALILDHHRNATTATDRVAALVAANRSSCPERRDLLEQTYEQWKGHLGAYANYLRIVPSGTRDDVFDMIKDETKRPTFDVTHPTWSRALFLPMAVNNKMLWTDRGIPWLTDTVIRLASINGYVASRMLNAFQHVARLKPDLRARIRAELQRIVRDVPESVSPTVHHQAGNYLG